MIATLEHCGECGEPYYMGDIEEPNDDLCPKCRGVKVVINASDECVVQAVETIKTGSEPDFTVTAAKLASAGLSERGPYFTIAWETVSAGFGELTLYHDAEGTLRMDTECMSLEFVANVFVKFLESAKDSRA